MPMAGAFSQSERTIAHLMALPGSNQIIKVRGGGGGGTRRHKAQNTAQLLTDTTDAQFPNW